MRAALFDSGQQCGTEANMAKMLASEASRCAGEVCVPTHGAFGVAKEFDIEATHAALPHGLPKFQDGG